MKTINTNRLLFRTVLFFIFVCFLDFHVFPQRQEELKHDSITKHEKPVKPPKYSLSSSGFASFTYRDFATSPLFYRGPSMRFSYGNLRIDERIDQMWFIDFGGGAAFAKIPKSSYLQSYTTAFFLRGELYFHLLYDIKRLSNSFCNVKFGGSGAYFANVRYNESLGNNGIGVDNIFNLMFAMKASKDISRKTEKTRNWLFIQKVLKPKKRTLCFQVNTGILNFNYRPGYAYSYSGELDGNNTHPVGWMFQDYKWSMNGWRLSTKLNFTSYLSNGNARQFAYVWDAVGAPGRHSGFEMATHRLQITILFNTK